MNRTGLLIALAVAALVGVLFAVYPQLDLDLAGLFFDPQVRNFGIGQKTWVLRARDVVQYGIAALVAPAFLAVIGKVLLPQRRMLIPGRAAVFLIVTLALAPGVVANLIFKQHWERPRPIDVTEFAGTDRFMPWWDPRGACPSNCSFVAGEPSGAFWTLAPAALAPPQWRPLAYGGAIAFGAAVGVLRMTGGAHFFTDIVFAGVFTFLVIWTVHGLIYRWGPTHMTDKAVERPLTQAGLALRRALAGLARSIGGGAKPQK
jgi:membrane-associated PAP2 superfamily phosphatase